MCIMDTIDESKLPLVKQLWEDIMTDDIQVKTMTIKNFRAIKNAKINLDERTIIVGKNNIGKSSLIDVFKHIQEPQLSDFNADLIHHIWESKDSIDLLKKHLLEFTMSLNILYKWSGLTVPYWNFLSDIADSGETEIEIVNYLPEERLEQLSKIKSTKELPSLFECMAKVGTPEEIKNNLARPVPINKVRKLIPQFCNPEKAKIGDMLIYPISAFRYVQTGENSNERITADQFSSELATDLSDKADVLKGIQKSVDTDLQPQMKQLEDRLASFAYPKVEGAPIKATLTIDEWLNNPQLRISQTFDNLPGFELPLSSQGLGYQNIYNIIARISNLFSKLSERGAKVPVMIVIEEPEAFTHPQLQHVFIQKISEHIADYAERLEISYQLVIISHSPEVAVSALDALDFKLVIGRQHNDTTRFLNWSELGGNDGDAEESRNKLKKLMLNYNAELLFSDKLIAYEGDGERLLLGGLSRAVKKQYPDSSWDKIAWIPVGTHFEGYRKALADLLFDKILLITDIDYGIENGYDKPDMTRSTNQNCRFLFPLRDGKLVSIQRPKSIDLGGVGEYLESRWYLSKENELIEPDTNLKHTHTRFVVVSEGKPKDFDIWPRTLESALVFASKSNFTLYAEANLLRKEITADNVSNELNDVERRLLASGLHKADFALESQSIIENDEFVVPVYLKYGLEWLVKNE